MALPKSIIICKTTQKRNSTIAILMCAFQVFKSMLQTYNWT